MKINNSIELSSCSSIDND